MMNTDPSNMPVTFHFDSHEIQVLYNAQGEAWFIASDVAAVLGYRDALNMVRWLDDDESDTQIMSIRSVNGVIQDREVTIISESGLYHALLKSRRPEAKPFRRWVTHEVLPALRRTGAYSTRSAASQQPESRSESSRAFESADWLVEECDSISTLPILGPTAIAQFSSLVSLFESAYRMSTDEAVQAASRVWLHQTGIDLGIIFRQAFAPRVKSPWAGLLDVSLNWPPSKPKP